MGDRVVLAGLSGRRVSTLQGRRAAVSGGATGTGAAIVARLRSAGALDAVDDPLPGTGIDAWVCTQMQPARSSAGTIINAATCSSDLIIKRCNIFHLMQLALVVCR